MELRNDTLKKRPVSSIMLMLKLSDCEFLISVKLTTYFNPPCSAIAFRISICKIKVVIDLHPFGLNNFRRFQFLLRCYSNLCFSCLNIASLLNFSFCFNYFLAILYTWNNKYTSFGWYIYTHTCAHAHTNPIHPCTARIQRSRNMCTIPCLSI